MKRISRSEVSYGLFAPNVTGTGDSDRFYDLNFFNKGPYDRVPAESAYE